MSSPCLPGPAAHNPYTKLGVASLDAVVCTLIDRAVTPSTLAAYQLGKRRYLSLCGQFSFSPLPLEERVHCRFVASLFAASLQVWSQQPHSSDRVMLWAAFCTVFFGFLRDWRVHLPFPGSLCRAYALTRGRGSGLTHGPHTPHNSPEAGQDRPFQCRNHIACRRHWRCSLPSHGSTCIPGHSARPFISL